MKQLEFEFDIAINYDLLRRIIKEEKKKKSITLASDGKFVYICQTKHNSPIKLFNHKKRSDIHWRFINSSDGIYVIN